MDGIYSINCQANQKCYIGSAKWLNRRWQVHVGMLNNQTHFNRHLQRAWNKYGCESFEYSILEDLGEYNKVLFFAKENEWMQKLRSEGYSLFNIAKAEGGWGPETFDRRHEIASKISNSLKVYFDSLDSETKKTIYGSGKRGKLLSAEHRRKTSEGLQGFKRSKANCQNISDGLKRHPALIAAGKIHGVKNLMKQGDEPVNSIPIIINGIEFSNMKKAARAIGVPYHVLFRMRKIENYIIPPKWRDKLTHVKFSR